MRVVRHLVALAIAACALGVAPSTAFAHGAVGATDYRNELTEVTGDATGVEVRLVALGERLEATRTSAAEVVILGYQHEPYLRLDSEGVWRNTSSPATYLNEDRYAAVVLPPQADAGAAPTWEHLSSGDTVSWHDHRSHWMSPEPPPIVQGEPDLEHVVYEDQIALVVDGREVTIGTRVTWVPPPDSTWWLVGASAAGAIAIVAVTRWRRSAPAFTLLGCATALTARPQGIPWLLVAVAAVLVALVALWRRSTTIAAAAGAVVLAIAASRLDVFSRALVPGSIPATIQRLLLVAAVAGGAASVFAAMLGVASGTGSARYARNSS